MDSFLSIILTQLKWVIGDLILNVHFQFLKVSYFHQIQNNFNIKISY